MHWIDYCLNFLLHEKVNFWIMAYIRRWGQGHMLTISCYSFFWNTQKIVDFVQVWLPKTQQERKDFCDNWMRSFSLHLTIKLLKWTKKCWFTYERYVQSTTMSYHIGVTDTLSKWTNFCHLFNCHNFHTYIVKLFVFFSSVRIKIECENVLFEFYLQTVYNCLVVTL